MSTLSGFSDKEREYHAYQARMNYLRQQRSIQRRIEELEAAEQAAAARINEVLAAEKQARAAEEQARAAEGQARADAARERAERETARAAEAAALAEVERLRRLLQQRP